MLLAHLALGRISKVSGLLAGGLLRSFPSPLPIRNFPVVVAAHVWGSQWSRQLVLFRSDNEAVVHLLNLRTSRTPSLMQPLRSLLLSSACYSFLFLRRHIPGVNNLIAEALLRFRWQEFQQLAPEVQLLLTSIPTQLLLDLTPPSSQESGCVAFLMHGLSSSTLRTYATAQQQFREFCHELGKLHPSGSPCSADEWTLCLFGTVRSSLHNRGVFVPKHGLPRSLQDLGSLHCYFGFLRSAEFTVPS